MGSSQSKISFQTLRERLRDSSFSVVKTGPCYVSHHTVASIASPGTQRFGILVKTKKDCVHLMFHFKFKKFLPEGWEQSMRRDEVRTLLPFYQYYVTKSGQPWPRNQKDDGTKVLSVEGTFTRPKGNPFVTGTDSSNVNDVAKALVDATHLDGEEGKAFVFSKKTSVDAEKFKGVRIVSTGGFYDIDENLHDEERKWGSPIYLKDVGRLTSKCDTKDQYFRVKPVDISLAYREERGGRALVVDKSKDMIRWTQELLDQRQEWHTAFKNAKKNSPDEATVNRFVASLVSPTRRLACETSPFVDFLSVLAILLPILFLIYWMFLRRIYYPERNTPTIRKTVKGPRFRAAL